MICSNLASDKKVNLSVIIPVYNVEEYLSECIDSVMNQHDICLEIILVNDGSTDSSGLIADQYAERFSQIKVKHKKNGGASSARNAGLELAKGEYIAFIDSDDWVKENSLSELYHKTNMYQSDMALGNMLYYRQDGSTDNPFEPVPKELCNVIHSGKDGFIHLIKSDSYPPMACSYIYKRMYLEKIHARFEEGIMHEDELWTPIALCQAGKFVIVDIDFYYYRQREGSVMHSMNRNKRLDALFRVTDRLIEFADHFDFSGEDGELKNWLYVIIFRLYSWTFTLLSRTKDSSNIIPKHHLDCFWRDCWQMMPEPQKICLNYFKEAEKGLKEYTDWRISHWVASVDYKKKTGKKMMLIYNTIRGKDLFLEINNIPANWIITTDRRHFYQADVVVFYLPGLQQEMGHDLHKLKGQIWVAWYMESGKNYPYVKFPEIRAMFDLWMCFRQDADVVYPYYRYEYIELFSKKLSMHYKQNKTCMFVSGRINESNSMEYLKELMEYTEVESYGSLYNNKELPKDITIEEKLELLRNYKFVIAFENAIDHDFITDNFYDPLVAGSVPIYLGAPNIDDFAPGGNCFLDVRQFNDAHSLAHFINACYDNEQLYSKFFEWKTQPLQQSFLQKAEALKEHPIVCLCRKLEERQFDEKHFEKKD